MIEITQAIAEMESAAALFEQQAARFRQIAAELRGEGPAGPPWADRVAEMPVNQKPFHPDMVKRGWVDWPYRISSFEDVKGITIHHTLSHSPLATAQYCTATKGYPSIQYHLWVSQGDGCPVYLLAPFRWALWHDHTGAHPKTVSVGMAGSLHKSKPPEEQLEAAARAVAYLMDLFDIPVGEVQGHCDRWKGTVCPGWYATGWAEAFYEALRGAL